MPCKGICTRYKTAGRYATGSKRCNQCNLFIKWDGLLCPCCGYKLRTRPRHSKFKEKLREQKGIQQAKVSSLPIMPNESYLFSYDAKRGLEIEFRHSNHQN